MHRRFHQGAEVQRRYALLPSKACEINERKTSERQSEAYKLAIANPKKSWAKRWLRERRFMS